MTVRSIIFAGPNELIKQEKNTKVIYTNSYSDETNIKYCLLRSDVVILGDESGKEKAFCEWYHIPTLDALSFDTLTKETRISLAGTFTKEHLNYVYGQLLKVDKNFTLFSEKIEAPANKIARELIRRKN